MTAGELPDRTEFVIRAAHVLTMDPAHGQIARGDVHVRDGRIVAVGEGLPAGTAASIDGTGCVVLPGLVDTHWHLWNTTYRSLAGSTERDGYFALNLRYGPAFTPEDTYRAVRLALADALSGGITTVHNWAHNLVGPEHADANLRAMAETGVRGRFSYGPPQGVAADRTCDLADLRRVHGQWTGGSGPFEDGLLTLGLAGRPPGLVPPEVYRAEWAAASDLGLPVSYHASATRQLQRLGTIQTLHAEGMLGPNTQLIHALHTSAAERDLLAATGTTVSLSPWTELMIGYGVPPVHDLLAAGVRVSLSVDTVALSGTADMFSIMRLAINLAHGQAGQEFGLTARRVLELATAEAARDLGLGEVTGSLTPGKRADLIMVRTDEVNVAPCTDPANLLVLAAAPSNVDTVVVDGRILKRGGRLTALDPRQAVRDVTESLAALRRRCAPPA